MREAAKRGEKLGFTDEELAFYDALEVNDSAVKVLGDETLRTIARELVETVHRNVTYGLEIKNTLSYITRDEMRTKIQMCELFGIRPLFIVRMAPKSYIEEVRQRGGFTLVFKYQLYPHGHADLATQVRNRLLLPVDCPTAISEGTVQRFLKWHQRQQP
jgi:hypothetical protein